MASTNPKLLMGSNSVLQDSSVSPPIMELTVTNKSIDEGSAPWQRVSFRMQFTGCWWRLFGLQHSTKEVLMEFDGTAAARFRSIP